MENSVLRPQAEANRITLMLDQVLGADRFDRSPLDMRQLAMEYSASTAADEPIALVEGRPLIGCEGLLIPSDGVPRRWAIAYNSSQSEGRRNFTIGHEFGHYVLHRQMLGPDGIRCNEAAVIYRDGEGIEKEADQFAATLLMPFSDFRRQIPEKQAASFDDLGRAAARYGVSLTAATLRWLEYTSRRAVLVVSNEGFALWSKSSSPALKTGRFIRTRNTVFELPAISMATSGAHDEESRHGIERSSGIWFPEPCVEMCVRSERYDLELTLLHFEDAPVMSELAADDVEDTFERLMASR